MKLYEFTFNIFIEDTFIGIASVNSFDSYHAKSKILDYCLGKFCNQWEINSILKIFCNNIKVHNDIVFDHDTIISIDYSVKYTKKEN